MRTKLLRGGLAAIVLVLAVPVYAADQTFERTLQVTGTVTLNASTGSGDIVIKVGSESAVKVVGTVRPNNSWGISASDAEAAVRSVVASPPITQQGNTIDVGKFADSELSRRVSISFDITLPRTSTLSLRSGSGDISVGDVAGPVNAQAGSGDISIGKIDATVKAQVGSGDIVVSGAKDVDVSTGSGDVRVAQAGGTVNVRTGSGDIQIAQVGQGSLDVSTGSGDVSATGLTGPAKVRTASGEVRLAGKPSADWDVSTASAGVVIDIPDGTGFRIVASSISGAINNDHGASPTFSSKRDYQATVGQGGPVVQVKSASGSVSIRKGAAAR